MNVDGGTPPPVRIELTDQPGEEALACIQKGLVAFNAGSAGARDRRALAVIVSTEDGTCQGGLAGYTAWGWLFVEKFWLADEVRGRGLASRLLCEAEAEAVRRCCHGAWLDTFNPDARKIYERQGYRVFGELTDFPIGRTRWFLQKPLVVDSPQSPSPNKTGMRRQ